MIYRLLTLILLGFVILSCNNSKGNKVEIETSTNTSATPNYAYGIQFLNSYVKFIDSADSNLDIVKWINNRSDVTDSFKKELKMIIEDAEKKDPEYGLGFDPVLDAQDYPKEFKTEKSDSNYVIVSGVDWTEFRLTIKMEKVDNIWRIDGAGIVNIPEGKRIKR